MLFRGQKQSAVTACNDAALPPISCRFLCLRFRNGVYMRQNWNSLNFDNFKSIFQLKNESFHSISNPVSPHPLPHPYAPHPALPPHRMPSAASPQPKYLPAPTIPCTSAAPPPSANRLPPCRCGAPFVCSTASQFGVTHVGIIPPLLLRLFPFLPLPRAAVAHPLSPPYAKGKETVPALRLFRCGSTRKAKSTG